MAAGKVGQILGEHSEQMHHGLKPVWRDDRRFEISFARLPFPIRVLLAPEHLENQLEIALGRWAAKDLSAHQCSHMLAVHHHWHGDIGQARKAGDLLRNELFAGASFRAFFGCPAGIATHRSFGDERAEGVFKLAKAQALVGLQRWDDFQRHSRHFAERRLVILNYGQAGQVIEVEYFHTRSELLMPCYL
jgi:hypothetical protein